MRKYRIKIKPLTWTNDFPTVKEEIVCKKIDPAKLIKRYYDKKVEHTIKSKGGYYQMHRKTLPFRAGDIRCVCRICTSN